MIMANRYSAERLPSTANIIIMKYFIHVCNKFSSIFGKFAPSTKFYFWAGLFSQHQLTMEIFKIGKRIVLIK